MSVLTEFRGIREEVDELLAAHTATRDVSDFAKYVGRPLDFMREELAFVPYAKQIEVIESFEANRRTVVRGCHGAGKDAVLGPLMLYAAYVRKMLVIAISATEKQLLNQLWAEVRNRFSARLPGELYQADLRIAGEKRIIAMTSNSVSSLTGYHDPNGVFIAISEAQGEMVEETAFDAAIANAVDDASRVVVAGNPIRAAGRFYEVSQKSTWHAIAISAFDHPNVAEGRVVIAGGPSPTWPAEMAAEFGTDSPWYIARVLGEFAPAGSVDSLLRREWLEAAYERYEQAPQLREEPRPLLALDVARSLERDESVAAIVQAARVHALYTWRVRDLVATAERAIAIADATDTEWSTVTMITPRSPMLLVIDSPGVGSGVVDECRRRKRQVIEYWGWSPARDTQRFLNQRAAVYWNLRTLLEKNLAALPRDPKLHEELLAMEWSEDKKGHIAMVPKEALRATLGRSPDRLDAITMGLGQSTGVLSQPASGFRPVY